MQELRRARYDLIAKSHAEHEAAETVGVHQATMKKMFKGQDITAFRHWREHVRQVVESRAMMTTHNKWRRQDAEKRQDAWTQWRNAVSLARAGTSRGSA